jgi:uncharacterized protein (DUF1330 family)
MAYGYLLVEMKITDMDQYKQYMASAQEAVKAAGGDYLVRGGRHEVMEGSWSPVRLAVLRFPSFEQAKAFYQDQQYTAARAKRKGATEFFNMVLVEGA